MLVQLVNLRYEEVHRWRFDLQKQDFRDVVILAYTALSGTCEEWNAFVLLEVLFIEPSCGRWESGWSFPKPEFLCVFGTDKTAVKNNSILLELLESGSELWEECSRLFEVEN